MAPGCGTDLSARASDLRRSETQTWIASMFLKLTCCHRAVPRPAELNGGKTRSIVTPTSSIGADAARRPTRQSPPWSTQPRERATARPRPKRRELQAQTAIESAHAWGPALLTPDLVLAFGFKMVTFKGASHRQKDATTVVAVTGPSCSTSYSSMALPIFLPRSREDGGFDCAGASGDSAPYSGSPRAA